MTPPEGRYILAKPRCSHGQRYRTQRAISNNPLRALVLCFPQETPLRDSLHRDYASSVEMKEAVLQYRLSVEWRTSTSGVGFSFHRSRISVHESERYVTRIASKPRCVIVTLPISNRAKIPEKISESQTLARPAIRYELHSQTRVPFHDRCKSM
jgi:hypothetical protein